MTLLGQINMTIILSNVHCLDFHQAQLFKKTGTDKLQDSHLVGDAITQTQ